MLARRQPSVPVVALVDATAGVAAFGVAFRHAAANEIVLRSAGQLEERSAVLGDLVGAAILGLGIAAESSLAARAVRSRSEASTERTTSPN